MFEIQNYFSFLAAVVAFQLFPGAGTITILDATARQGVSSGMSAVLGTITGDLIYMFAAVVGLAAVLGANPGVLRAAQWIGVCYLCWIGFKLFRSSLSDQPRSPVTAGARGHFRHALAVSLTNPKAMMFFMAFFPLFLGRESGPVTLFVLMAHVTVISLIFQTGLVFVGLAVMQRLSRWRSARSFANRLIGLIFISFGVKLALNIR